MAAGKLALEVVKVAEGWILRAGSNVLPRVFRTKGEAVNLLDDLKYMLGLTTKKAAVERAANPETAQQIAELVPPGHPIRQALGDFSRSGPTGGIDSLGPDPVTGAGIITSPVQTGKELLPSFQFPRGGSSGGRDYVGPPTQGVLRSVSPGSELGFPVPQLGDIPRLIDPVTPPFELPQGGRPSEILNFNPTSAIPDPGSQAIAPGLAETPTQLPPSDPRFIGPIQPPAPGSPRFIGPLQPPEGHNSPSPEATTAVNEANKKAAEKELSKQGGGILKTIALLATGATAGALLGGRENPTPPSQPRVNPEQLQQLLLLQKLLQAAGGRTQGGLPQFGPNPTSLPSLSSL